MRIEGLALVGAFALVFAIGCGDDDRPPSGDDGGVGVDSGGGGECGSLAMCAGDCVDTRFDPSNCGGCGAACGAGEVCSMGTCGGSCGSGTTDCGGRCVDTTVDPGNCGGCGTACASGQVCAGGTCALECPGGTTDCTGSCVDTASNINHCGGCGIICAAGEACTGGVCGMRPTIDADGDTISDFDEQESIPRDTDADGTPDFMDLDSDDDGISDADEAGDTDVMTPPVDSDLDGTPDFQDLDSDNDGLLDSEEVTLGTDPTLADTDGDGESDGVEVAGGSDPLDAMSTLAGSGDFTFDLLPGGMDRTDTLQFDPAIQKADVFFLIDTTGSMGGEINNLQTSLSGLVTTIRATIPDTNFGVGRFDDFPVAGYGSGADRPFILVQRVTNVMADITTGVNSLDMPLHGGVDGPESQIEALFQVAAGRGFRSATGTVWTPPFMAMMGYDVTRGHGLIGGGGFRMDALPIIIMATDATFHRHWGDVTPTSNRVTWCGDAQTDPCEAYAMANFGSAADQVPRTRVQALTALNGIGAKVMGVASEAAAGSDQRTELSSFAVRTGAWKAPTGGMCNTGLGGANRPAENYDPDGAGPLPTMPLCPLVYSISSTGTGLAGSIVGAIGDLTSFVSFSTLHTEARDNPATAVDESRFFVRGIPVSADPMTCSPIPAVADRLTGSPPMPGADGTFDSFTGVVPGCLVTFQIVARNDGFVPQACADQVFNMDVIVVGDDVVEADRRTVVVRVPGDRTLCVP